MSSTEKKVKITVGQVKEMLKCCIEPPYISVISDQFNKDTADTEVYYLSVINAQDLLGRGYRINSIPLGYTEIGKSIQSQLYAITENK